MAVGVGVGVGCGAGNVVDARYIRVCRVAPRVESTDLIMVTFVEALSPVLL